MQHVSRQLLGALAGVAALASACGGAPLQPEQPRGAARTGESHAEIRTCERRGPAVGAKRVDAVRQGSTVALVRDGAGPLHAYVADEDEDVIHTIDVDSGTLKATTPLAGSPSQLLVLADGRVAVALRNKNLVQVLEPAADVTAQLASLCEVKVPTEPVALATTPADDRLLVSSAWAKQLTAYDTRKMERVATYDLPREPRAVVVDDDGQRAFVSHVVGATMSVVDLADAKAADPRKIDLRVSKLNAGVLDPKLRGGCQGFALAKSVTADDDGPGEKPLVTGKAPKKETPATPRGRIFAPMVTVDPGESTVRSAGYGNPVDLVPVEAPIVSVVDTGAERTLTKTVMSTGARHNKECLLPRAATFDPDRSTLLVACQGTDVLLELDARGLDPVRLERRRWPVPSGPTGIALDRGGARAVVWSQFDHELVTIPLAKDGKAKTTVRVVLPRSPKSRITPQIAWGRELFHKTDDDRISGDGRACASCHPDGREDALTWSTPEGPRQTIMLAGRLQGSAPFSWFGSHADLKAHVTVTFQRLGGSGLPDDADRFDELDALVAYLESMQGPTIEGQVGDAAQRELVARGKELFFGQAQGCASCHVGGPGTDKTAHDVGSKAPADAKPAFDTPSLRFVSGTAPYFHDGRYSTLDELLAATDDRMGHTLHLGRRDVLALKAYLETL